MSKELPGKVEMQENGILLSEALFEGNSDKVFEVRQLGRHVLVQPQSFSVQVRGPVSNSCYCTVDTFLRILEGLRSNKFSGSVHTDMGMAVKTLYFNKGELVFASSNLMDDRLGEVCHKDSLITLEDLLNSTVQVDKNLKFGQVLLRDNIFSHVKLQDALCRQVIQIARSLFMVDRLFFETVEGVNAPLQVVQDHDFSMFLEQSHAYGAIFRDFKARIELDSSIEVAGDGGVGNTGMQLMPGTFYGDLVLLIKENTYISNIIQFSKLNEMNTLAGIMHLYNCGFLKIDPMLPRNTDSYSPACSRIKAAVDIYSYIIKKALDLFTAAGKKFPHADHREMLTKTSDSISYFEVDKGLLFTGECIHRMMLQGTAASGRINFFEHSIDRVTQFVIQVSLDNLSFDQAKELKTLYSQLSSL